MRVPMKSFTFARMPALLSGSGSYERFLDQCRERHIHDIALISGGSWFPGSEFERIVARTFSDGRIRGFISQGEPDAPVIDSIAGKLREDPPDLIIAVGGGSVLDTGKAVAGMVCEVGSVEEYLEGVGTRSLTGNRIAFAAVPTTAGTGSEATKNAVVSRIGESGYKKSLRHDNYVPDYAVLDPELSRSCPRNITIVAGLDAVTQLLEAFVSTAASPLSEALSTHGLEIAVKALPMAIDHPDDLDMRNTMSYAAYLSGVALANAGLGVVHGLASPLGAIRNAPHGAVCAALLPAATRSITERLECAGESGREGFSSYAKAGRLFAGVTDMENAGLDDKSAVTLLCETLDGWKTQYDVSSLSDLGFTRHEISRASETASGKNTPLTLSTEDIYTLCMEAYTR